MRNGLRPSCNTEPRLLAGSIRTLTTRTSFPSRIDSFRPPCGLQQQQQQQQQQQHCGLAPPPVSSVRWAGTRTRVKLSDLPQGLLKADAAPEQQPASVEGEDAEPTYPTVIQQARNNMRKFENCVVLTRVGGFYEFYFEQAEKYGPLLNLKVAMRSGIKAGPVAMAGFPYSQLERYLKMLVVDLNQYVAISEEFPNTVSGRVKSGGLLFDRRVVRVVTPGTLVDEKFMDPLTNNFCLAIHVEEDETSQGLEREDEKVRSLALDKLNAADRRIGLAWLDLSTGQFFTQISTFAGLPSILARVGAKELVLKEELTEPLKSLLLGILGPEQLLVSWRPACSTMSTAGDWQPMLDSPMPEDVQKSLTDPEIRAGGMLLEYVADRLQGSDTKLQPPVVRRDTDNMIIDKHTLRGLELLETISQSSYPGAKGSLLHAVRRTVTNSGARLLRDRITQPSASLSVIETRLDLVEELLAQPDLMKTVVSLLTKTFDTHRLVSRIALGKGESDDLICISRTISLTEDIVDAIQASRLTGQTNISGALLKLCGRMALRGPAELKARISAAIDEGGLLASQEIQLHESSELARMAQEVIGSEGGIEDAQAFGTVVRAKTVQQHKQDDQDDAEEDSWVMRRTASPALDNLHQELDRLKQAKSRLCEMLRETSKANTLTLKWSPGFGHFCHVRTQRDVKASVASFPSSRTVSKPSKSSRSFYLPDWATLGSTIDHTRTKIKAEEQLVFGELRRAVIQELILLRRNAKILDELDVACSSATLAQEQNAVRPILDDSTSMKVIGGRHPTVTVGLEERGRLFVANDCFLNVARSDGTSQHESGGERIHLVTGPNMAGKSTFLRQNALLAIMAQVGLYVPAAFAQIGVVDAVFARIGSADNLFSDQSTFMTEMLETAHILRNASRRSLVIMDEIGRGTTPEDGTAVAYAALWHLRHINQCRALFATHFHSLADMTSDWEASDIGRYCTDIKETGAGGFVYLHKVRAGVNRKSHALKVAGIAGLPEQAIQVAQDILKRNGFGKEAPVT